MKLRVALTALALGITAPALAASAFDGTWKADVASVKLPTKPDVILLANGVYSCSSCNPKLTVPADGAFHKVSNQNNYFDEAAVKVIDARTIEETDKRKGRIVYTSTSRVAADGKTQQIKWSDSAAPDGKTTTGVVNQMRVGAAAKGAHAVSGQWRTTSVGNISDADLTVSFATTGAIFKSSTPNGYGYTATLGGKPVSPIGDPSGMMTAVRKVDAMTVVETNTRKGEMRSTRTMTVQPGGKTIKVDNVNKAQGTTTSYMLTKQ